MNKTKNKWIVSAASAALVASAIVPVASAASFSDIENNDHKDAILALAEAGIISGYTDGTFKPNAEVTRGNVTKLLGKWLVTEGYEIPEDYKTVERFTDLPVDSSDEELVKYAALVKDEGVFKGSNNKLMQADKMSREQMAVVLVRALNTVYGVDLVADYKAADFESKLTDLDKANAEENRDAIIALEYAEITKVANGLFNPKNTVTRGQFASFLHRAITNVAPADVKVESVTAVNGTLTVKLAEKAEKVDVKDFTVTQAINGGEAKEVTPSKAELAEDGLTVTLTVDKVAVDATTNQSVVYTVNKVAAEAFVVAATPKVESVSANNLKTMVVNFNQEVDKETITADTLKVFEGTNTSATVVDTDIADGISAGQVNYQLSEDKKSVTVVFGTTLTQSKDLRVVVEGVKTTDGKVVEKYDGKLTATDTTVPTVEGVKVNNAKSLEIQFSEPVNISALTNQVLANIKVDGNAVIGTLKQDFTKDTVTVSLATALSAGTHDIKVFDVKDFSGLKAADKNVSVEVVADTKAPEILSAKVVSKNVIEIETSEQLEDLGTIKVGSTTATVNRVEGSLTKYKLTNFGNLDLSAVVEVTLKYKDQTDVVGNKVSEEKTFTFKASDDTVLPTVTAQVLNETNKKNFVKLSFSKPMQTSLGTIKVLKADGTTYKTISVSSVASQFNTDKTELQLTAADLGFTNTDIESYKLEISDMKDNTIRENLLAKTTLEIKTVDTKAPTVANKYVVTEGTTTDGDTVKITFSEVMDEASISNLSNFTYNGKTLSAISGAKLQAISLDKKSVTFVVPNARAGHEMTVYAVKDANGILLEGTQTIEKATSSNSALALAGEADDVVAIDKRTVKVKLNTPLATVDPSTFVLQKDNVADVTFVNAVLDSEDSTNQTVILTANKDLNADADVYTLYTTATPTLTKNVFGNSLAASTSLKAVKDEIAPEIKSVKAGDTINDGESTVSNDKFTVEFTEAVTTTTADALLTDLIVKKSDGKLLTPGTDYSVSTTDIGNDTNITGDTKVVIELADGLYVDGDYTFSVAVSAPRNIKDGADNLLKEYAASTVNVKYTNDAPSVTTAVLEKGTDVGTIKLTSVTTDMEYKLNQGEWTAFSSTLLDNLDVNIGDVIQVRTKANGLIPAGEVQTLKITASDIKEAAAPNISSEAATNTTGSTKLTGLTDKVVYEYVLDDNASLDADAEAWKSATELIASGTEADDIAANSKQYIHIRVKETATKPASEVKDLQVVVK